MSTLERAIAIAAEAHMGQVDKAGAPYILHPMRVMLRVETPVERIAAVLHDVVEDTAWTLEGLATEGFAPEVVAAVDALTRREGESYEAFVARAGADPVARVVKLADLAENMDLGRIASPTAPDIARLDRYRRAVAQLTGEPA
ncbi:MAG TPA: HD domain-containing protein [Longimicrobium sp.]|jgi:(p)ppGpp synthase/HD superfamily hydrolase